MSVVITETLDAEPAAWLGERANVVWCSHQDPAFDRHLATADALVVRTYTLVNNALLAKAPRVKVVGRAGVGLDNIDLPACQRRGVMVVSTPDANTQAVVEYLFGLILDDIRPRYTLSAPVSPDDFHKLRKEQVGIELADLTLGILGFGRIGKRVGQVATALGMKVLVNDILPEEGLRRAVNYDFAFVAKPALYAGSDILTIHVDGRAENRQMMNAAAMAQLRPSCMFINAARGMLVDNNALAAWAKANAAKGGRLILDVHDPEPMPPEYPLYGLPNVRLLPHLASRTDKALKNMSWVVRDVLAVLEGRKPQYPAY
jgi:phosphoglycerate dehydrogenase-like enzyme